MTRRRAALVVRIALTACAAVLFGQSLLRADTAPAARGAKTRDELRFAPPDVTVMDARVATAGDGHWEAVSDPLRADAEPLLFATRLHPDAKRPGAEVFAVAVPVSQIRLYAVAGTVAPEATTLAGRAYARSGVIPPEPQRLLLAAFNGGLLRGNYAMRVDGVTLAPPDPSFCTLLGLDDGSLRIASWRVIANEAERAERAAHLVFWRQSAPCLYEGGQPNATLRDEQLRSQDTALDGEAVIRRSAVGLDQGRQFLYVGVSNATTARAIGEAMHHAGASDVAQLDMGWARPKFLLFPWAADGSRRALGLFQGFLFEPDDYVIRPSTRDFFYLVRREPAHHR